MSLKTFFVFQKGVPAPPSLVNMYKELSTDIPGFVKPNHGFLEGWAKQVSMKIKILFRFDGFRNLHK
jgi:uracil-DNA glycosylase